MGKRSATAPGSRASVPEPELVLERLLLERLVEEIGVVVQPEIARSAKTELQRVLPEEFESLATALDIDALPPGRPHSPGVELGGCIDTGEIEIDDHDVRNAATCQRPGGARADDPPAHDQDVGAIAHILHHATVAIPSPGRRVDCDGSQFPAPPPAPPLQPAATLAAMLSVERGSDRVSELLIGAGIAWCVAIAGCASWRPDVMPLPDAPPMSAKRIEQDVAWLSDDAREGRGLGTDGLTAAAAYIATAFESAGFSPGGDDGTYLQRFDMPTAIRVAEARIAIRGLELERGLEFEALLSSENGAVESSLVFAGYGISASEFGYDDYEGIDVTGNVVMVPRRSPPPPPHPASRGWAEGTAFDSSTVPTRSPTPGATALARSSWSPALRTPSTCPPAQEASGRTPRFSRRR